MLAEVSRVKILLVANTGWYLFNFRRNLVRELNRCGAEVCLVCPPDRYTPQLQAEGLRCLPWKLSRSGMNPWREAAALWDLVHIYRRERPDLVHHFTIKCITYGTLAARCAGVDRIVNTVTGLGHVFLSDSLQMRVLRPLVRRWYAWALTSRGVLPMFQNRDDLAVLVAQVPLLARKAVLSNGSGVDVRRFAPGPPATPAREMRLPSVVFAGRLIRQKGIVEFVEAARILRSRGLPADFLVCGAVDPGNPSSISPELCEEWQRAGLIRHLGHVEEIKQVLREAEIVVLPSYREGTPRVLLEAAALARPVIATDVPGCREAVVHERTGLLVPPRDPAALAEAIARLLADRPLRDRMGRAGRRLVVARFDERRVIRDTLSVYADLLASDALRRAAEALLPNARPKAAAVARSPLQTSPLPSTAMARTSLPEPSGHTAPSLDTKPRGELPITAALPEEGDRTIGHTRTEP